MTSLPGWCIQPCKTAQLSIWIGITYSSLYSIHCAHVTLTPVWLTSKSYSMQLGGFGWSTTLGCQFLITSIYMWSTTDRSCSMHSLQHMVITNRAVLLTVCTLGAGNTLSLIVCLSATAQMIYVQDVQLTHGYISRWSNVGHICKPQPSHGKLAHL